MSENLPHPGTTPPPSASRPGTLGVLTRRQHVLEDAAVVSDLLVHPATPLLFVFSGPSGVGKDSIVEELKKRPPQWRQATTVTTRPLRAGETNGVHYHFRTKEEFMQMLDRGEFLEWAEVYGHYYGTPRWELKTAADSGTDLLVKVDVQGAASIKQAVPQAILIFIAPNSTSDLVKRLATRKTESRHDQELRLEAARRELETIEEFDYVIINRDGGLAQAVDSAEAIVRAEKLRVAPRVFSPDS